MVYKKIFLIFSLIFFSCAPQVFYRSQKIAAKPWYQTQAGISRLATGVALHNCVITNEHKVKCWGYGTNGRLGNGSNSHSTTPVEVLIDSSRGHPVSLAGGDHHVCVLYENKTVQCWGAGGNGRLGNGSPSASVMNPIDVPVLNGAKEIISLYHFLCAILSDSRLYCMGLGNYVDGSGVNVLVPYDKGFSPLKITGNWAHACGLLTSGEVQCWGGDSYGKLGRGSSVTFDSNPGAVVSLPSDIMEVKATDEGTLAMASNGDVYCWGANHWGQCGTGAVGTSILTPVLVPGL